MDGFYSPLRYPGGKAKVADYFKQVFKDNLLYDGIYVEPYAGGSSVALSLLFNEYVSKIVINDIDKSIYAFWHSVLNDTDRLCKLINDTPISIDNWQKQKNIQKSKNRYGLLKVGFSTFFLNRTNRSGILNAGVIGGNSQSGAWKMDARFNKKELIKRIERIAYYKGKIELYNMDAIRLTQTLKKDLPAQTLFYFDPPYYVKGKDLYLNFYNDGDHNEIAKEVSDLNKHKWIVTYDNVPFIQKLYDNFRQVKYHLNYSAAAASKGEELMIFSNDLYVSQHSILQNFPK